MDIKSKKLFSSILVLTFITLVFSGNAFGSMNVISIQPKIHQIEELSNSLNPMILDYNYSHIVIGVTSSDSFEDLNDSSDNEGNIFICKYDKNWEFTKGIIYGGSRQDFYGDALIDEEGRLCLVGGTKSNDLPITNNSLGTCQEDKQSFNNWNGFFSCFHFDTLELVYGTYFKGNRKQFFNTIISNKNCYILSGTTTSDDITVTEEAVQKEKIGSQNAFLTVFSKSFNLVYSSYYGQGYVYPTQTSICSDTGKILLSGGTHTESQESIITSKDTKVPFQKNPGGENDGFFMVLNPSTYQIEYFTYLGKQENDLLSSSKWITPSKILLFGSTMSPDFYTTQDAYQTKEDVSEGSCFVVIFDLSKNAITYASFIGGREYDGALDCFILEDQSILLTGCTDSPNFPVTRNAIQNRISLKSANGFFCHIDQKGRLLYSTLIHFPYLKFFGSSSISRDSLYFSGYSVEPPQNLEKATIVEISLKYLHVIEIIDFYDG